MRTYSVKLPDKLHAELQHAAKASGENQSDIFRKALEAYLLNTKVTRPKASYLALTQDLCGCVSGPTDLSTNPKHLEGFGK